MKRLKHKSLYIYVTIDYVEIKYNPHSAEQAKGTQC